MEVDVGQKRGKNSALGSAASVLGQPAEVMCLSVLLGSTRLTRPFALVGRIFWFPLLDRCFQEEADQVKHAAVGDSAGKSFQELIVGDGIKVTDQVGVVDGGEAGSEVVVDGAKGLMSVAPRTEAEGTIEEVGLKDRLQDEQAGGLDDAVANGGDAQRTLPAVGFGDVLTADGEGAIVLADELLLKLGKESLNGAGGLF